MPKENTAARRGTRRERGSLRQKTDKKNCLVNLAKGAKPHHAVREAHAIVREAQKKTKPQPWSGSSSDFIEAPTWCTVYGLREEDLCCRVTVTVTVTVGVTFSAQEGL